MNKQTEQSPTKAYFADNIKQTTRKTHTALTDLDSKVLEAILRLLLILLTLLLHCAMVTLYTKALSLVSVAAEPYEHSF